MNNIEQIVFSFFGKRSLADCSVEELRAFRDEYPFFSTAHYLYSRKLREDADASAYNEFNRSSIHFHNPLLVDFLLDERSSNKTSKQMHPDPTPLKAQPEEDPFNDEVVLVNRHGPADRSNGTNAPAEKEEEVKVIEAEKKIDDEKKEQVQDIAFEPYHTVDYFASQGIKTVVEETPKDRFGQQLKSFTDWLKTLKKLPESDIARTIPVVSEEKVITLAEHSIENREVVTESMAEVWAKQGQVQKAIEVYEKLSLLNPSKSAYFASLIENLKEH